ncbi:hypothetical protein AQUCO_00600244v1 [Aquilegia coerulea]|uniref:C2 domain-containing protein n=1 Tax=Aquilegia coerulea TaxID=218851 RepID=A0A2G5ENV4_AQUCA|nr:hypothetical protein AQUCO_00600244v1 [Aquilegia coerulea]
MEAKFLCDVIIDTLPKITNIYVNINTLDKMFHWPEFGGHVYLILITYQLELIKDQVANIYLWPKTLEVVIIDPNLMGASDPYVQLKLTEQRLPSRKTTVGIHDKMGMDVISLKDLTPDVTKVMTLDLLKNMDPNDVQNEKSRGLIVLEDILKDLEDSNTVEKASEGTPSSGGLLVVIIHEAKDFEGKHHTNPYQRKKNRDPRWEEEFTFMLEEPPTNDRMHIEVISASLIICILHAKVASSRPLFLPSN